MYTTPVGQYDSESVFVDCRTVPLSHCSTVSLSDDLHAFDFHSVYALVMNHSSAWWRRLPFFANPPTLNQRQWRIFGLVALVTVFGTYDVTLLPLALPQIQSSLAIPKDEVSNWIALIRLGALPAFALALAADRLGRRRLLLLALVAFSLLTGATALAPSVRIFVALQFLVRTFTVAGGLLAGVMIVEEFPESARGWGVGAHAALASVGGGIGALFFAAVELLPFGWRTLYLLGLLALLVSPLVYRQLPETTRFQAQQQAAKQARIWQPLQQLWRAYPVRFIVVGSIVFLMNIGLDAALFYDPTYLQQARGWQPWHISLLNLGAGFMAPLGSAASGQWSDRFGRKRTTLLFLLALPLFIIAYFNSTGWLLPLLWAGMLFTSIGTGVAFGALNTELFPTAYRATAAGATAVIATVGGVLSLLVHSQLLPFTQSPWTAVSWLALLVFVVPPLLLRLPETSGRTLEEIAPERKI